MKKIKEVKINDELTLKVVEDTEWNEFRIMAFVNGKQIRINEELDTSMTYGKHATSYCYFTDDKQDALDTLKEEVKFFKAKPDYHKSLKFETI